LQSPPSSDGLAALHLQLLGRFGLQVSGNELLLLPSSQRLLALVALRGGDESRSCLAGMLWPAKNEARATANLRSVVFRIPVAVREHLVCTSTRIALDDCWRVDATAAQEVAGRVLSGGIAVVETTSLRADLLPDWDEPWLVAGRERFRQLRLHALEQLARNQLNVGRPDLAADASLAAVEVEPLRESAQELYIRALLAQGNRAAALGQYERFAHVLQDELRVQPSKTLAEIALGYGVATMR
jgi:DNA-binding SARP family transcriptional activator